MFPRDTIPKPAGVYVIISWPERNQGNVLGISGLDKLRLHTIVLKISVLEQFILRSRYTIRRADVATALIEQISHSSFYKQLPCTL